MPPTPHLSLPTRILAAALGLAGLWALSPRLCPATPDLDPAHLASVLLPLLAAVAFIRAALTGRDMEPRDGLFRLYPQGPVGEPATPDQLAHLLRLGHRPGGELSADEAARRINALESRLPATPAQQLELLRRGAPRGIFTRGSADRWLRRSAVESQGQAGEDYLAEWLEFWTDAGLEIQEPYLLDAEACWDFAQAWSRLEDCGVPYRLPERLHALAVGPEALRMGAALQMVPALRLAERRLLRRGVFRRALTDGELQALLPELLWLWRQDTDLEEGDLLLYLVVRHQPALLVQPWSHRDHVRWVEDCMAAGNLGPPA